MQAVIIAGGLGTRLGPIAADRPKSMVPILGKPFIDYQLNLLKECSINNVVLCLGHRSQQIAEHCGDGSQFGLNIKYSFEEIPMDTAGAVKLAEPLLEDYFFTIYGDSYVFIDFTDMFSLTRKKDKLGAMSVYKNQNRYDKSNTAIDNGYVTYYGKNQRQDLQFIDYGVNIFSKEVLFLIPEAKPYAMGTLFNQLIERSQLLAYEVNERFYEIGSLKGIEEFTEYERCRT